MANRICTVDGCARKHAARGFCQRHYTTEYRPLMPDGRKCSIGGCSGKHNAHGLCRAHYGRMKRHGTLESFRPRRDGCTVEGCYRDNTAGGYCLKHLRRVRKHGDPHRESPRVCISVGDDVAYSGLHWRIRAVRGPSSGQECVDCGGTAAHWSYNNSGVDEKIGDGMRYSTDIQQYDPRCAKCHKVFDKVS